MKLSFIIIDDRELDCYIAEKLIRKTGFSVSNQIFHDGVTALAFIKTTSPPNHMTVILLDIMMPIMTGFQFIEKFETLAPDVKKHYRIIPITTSLNKNEISRISNFESVSGVLRKPFTFEALVNALEAIPDISR